MKIITLLGPPAAGKGTQAAFFEKDGYFVFSFGQYMREQAAAGNPRFVEVKKIADTGALASDELVAEVIGAVIEKKHRLGFKGVVLDGSPRTENQARLLDELVARKSLPLKVIELRVPEDELNRRRLKRIFDSHARNEPVRDDDMEDVFQRRMQIYRKQTLPVTEHYKQQPGVLSVVDAATTPEQTWKLIQKALQDSAPRVPPGPAPS